MLSVRNLRVAYGPMEVVKGISFDVPQGSVVTLIGPNGAGKTTTLRTISGTRRPLDGTITLDGQAITGLPPDAIIRKGIVQVPEGRRIFANLTVEENLLVGGLCHGSRRVIREEAGRMYEAFPVLRERRHQLGGTLSGGEQQMLAIARALTARPRLLLLDEPSMGLAPQMVERVAEIIRDLRQRGVTILLVEQNAHVALSVGDYGYVMETGRIVLQDSAASLARNEDVRRAYLGV